MAILNQFAQNNLAMILVVMTILLVALIILSIVMLVKLSNAKKRYQMLLNGATGENLEDIIADNIAVMNELTVKNREIDADYAQMKTLFEKSIQKVAVHRFAAFSDTGGDLSYAVAMLDAHNTGIIFSSIFGRHESCTYAKPVVEGKSKYPLSAEESKVLSEALAK